MHMARWAFSNQQAGMDCWAQQMYEKGQCRAAQGSSRSSCISRSSALEAMHGHGNFKDGELFKFTVTIFQRRWKIPFVYMSPTDRP